MKGGPGAVAIFLFLLPGFLGLAVFDQLVEGPKREVFDRIIFALSITLLSSIAVSACFASPIIPTLPIGDKTGVFEVFGGLVGAWLARTTAASVLLSIALAVFGNYGLALRIARALRLTYRTSSVDVWQDMFYRYRAYWVRVDFKDNRILIGWPEYFSATGQPRELFLADATWWLPDANNQPAQMDVSGAGVYISNFDDVVGITLMK